MHIENSNKTVHFLISLNNFSWLTCKIKTSIFFRQWATPLKDYLLQGYITTEKRLKETENKFRELKQATSLVYNDVKTIPCRFS